MAEIVNLNKARKRHARADDEARAAVNRVKHGRTAAERASDERAAERHRREVAGAHLEREGKREGAAGDLPGPRAPDSTQ